MLTAALTLLAACGDADSPDVRSPPMPVPAAADDEAEDETEDATETETGAESGDESTTGDPLPDMPEADDADSGDEDPNPMPPEGDELELADAVDVVADVEDWMVTFVAIDDHGNALGHIRLRQDEKRRLWIDSTYHDGFAWVGLHPLTYDVMFNRATISVADIKLRAQMFADLLGAMPMDDDSACGLRLATAVSICAVAAATGISPKAGCPASMHAAACRCMAPYPAEYVCK